MTIYGFREDRSKVDISQIEDMHNVTNATGILAVAHGGTGSATADANRVFAGPASGNSAAPAFRALVAADIPAIPAGKITSGTLPTARGGTGSSTANPRTFFAGPASGNSAGAPGYRAISNDDLPTIAESKLPAIPATKISGTLKAANIPNLDASKITTGTIASADRLPSIPVAKISGTLPVSKGGTGATSVSANRVFAGPKSGSAAAPSFRALDPADIPSLNANKITAGTLPVSHGGTGKTSVNAKMFFAGPRSGSAAAPSFRTVTTADIADWSDTMVSNFGLYHGANYQPATHKGTNVNVGTGSTWTKVGEVKIPAKGLWFVTFSSEFETDHTGFRHAKLTTVSDTSQGIAVSNHFGYALQTPASGQFHMVVSGIVKASGAFTWGVYARQNSGKTLKFSWNVDMTQLSGK